MYLGLINDKCKSLFLGLAQKLVKADHVVDAAEKEMIDQYAFEMGIDVVYNGPAVKTTLKNF